MRRSVIAALVASVVVLAPVAAWAHVEVEPGEVPKGGSDVTLTFPIPNERADAGTVKVELQIPTDHPLLGVKAVATPGWTAALTGSALPEPVTTDAGTFDTVIGLVTWTGGPLSGEETAELSITVASLPTDTDQIQFKVLQTYDDGSVDSWIQETPPGGEEPEFPAPVLKLTGEAPAATTTEAAATSEPAESTAAPTSESADDSDSDDEGVNVLPIALGVLVLGGVGALIVARRRSAGSGGADGGAAQG